MSGRVREGLSRGGQGIVRRTLGCSVLVMYASISGNVLAMCSVVLYMMLFDLRRAVANREHVEGGN
jgi:hypothetical protein